MSRNSRPGPSRVSRCNHRVDFGERPIAVKHADLASVAPPTAEKKFNDAYWRKTGASTVVSRVQPRGGTEKVNTGSEDFLEKKGHVKPRDAIHDLIKNAKDYSFDCASFVRAVALSAWEAAKPDEVANLDDLRFREHGSTGLSHRSVHFPRSERVILPAYPGIRQDGPAQAEDRHLREGSPGEYAGRQQGLVQEL